MTTDVRALLTDLDGGVFENKMAQALSVAALAATTHQKKAKVVIEFEIEPIKKTSQAMVNHKLVFSHPTLYGKVSEENTTSTPMHVGRKGNLTIFSEDQDDWVGRGEQEAS